MNSAHCPNLERLADYCRVEIKKIASAKAAGVVSQRGDRAQFSTDGFHRPKDCVAVGDVNAERKSGAFIGFNLSCDRLARFLSAGQKGNREPLFAEGAGKGGPEPGSYAGNDCCLHTIQSLLVATKAYAMNLASGGHAAYLSRFGGVFQRRAVTLDN